MTIFYSDMEPLSEYFPVTLHLSPVTRVLNENPGRVCSFYLVIIIIIPLFTFGSIYRTNMLVGPSKITTETNNSNIIKHNGAKNPNRPEAKQLATYKRGPGFELGTTVNKSS